MLHDRTVPRVVFRSYSLLLLIGLVSLPTPLVAQAEHSNDTTKMIAAAARYAHALLEAHTVGLAEPVIALDRRAVVLGSTGLPDRGSRHKHALLAALSDELGARVADSDTVMVCGDDRRTCTMKAATVLIGVGIPQIGEGVARIPIELTYSVTNGRESVLTTGWIVVVERQGTEWRAVGTDQVWTT